MGYNMRLIQSLYKSSLALLQDTLKDITRSLVKDIHRGKRKKNCQNKIYPTIIPAIGSMVQAHTHQNMTYMLKQCPYRQMRIVVDKV